MLFRAAVLDRIASGEIGLAFRRWRRPTVKAGSALRTAAGVLAIDAVDDWTDRKISDADARAAGFADRGALLAELGRRDGGRLFRIAFHLAGDDPRIALRARSRLTPPELDAIRKALDGMDRRAAAPWTRAVLRLIAEHEGMAASLLAARLGVETLPLKRAVRRLKELGLTESLATGYRLSPRGRAALAALER